MSTSPQISELWTMKVYFKGTSGKYKTRPVLIIDYDETAKLYTIQELTGEPPSSNSYFQMTKESIVNWKSYGLDEQSYVKCSPTNTHRVERVRLIDKIGVFYEDEFEYIIEKIIEAKMSYKA